MSRARHLSADFEPAPGRRPRRNWRQRAVLGLGSTLVAVCLMGAAVGGYVLVKLNSIDRVDDLAVATAPKGGPENFLIVGSDSRAKGSTSERSSVEGKRSDTIMVLRVDPRSDRLSLLSFPRDLIVTISATGERARINSAFSREHGEQVLIDTLKQNFGISINHYVEIDFQGFQQLVDAAGGVSLWFGNAVRDLHSGLFVDQLGCVKLDGDMALKFARSRYLDYMTPSGWKRDPKSDLHRIERQQIFIRQAMAKALAQVKSNPLRLNRLVDIGVKNISVDKQLSLRDMLDLANNFKDFSSGRLETYSLPVVDNPADGGTTVLTSREEAEPVLNVFRGLPAGELSPGLVSVQVINGTDKQGFARDVSGALQSIGFDVSEPASTAERPPTSTVYYAPGQANYGQRVARHITGKVALAQDPDLESGQVRLVVGADFTTVHEQPMPLDKMPTTTVAGRRPPRRRRPPPRRRPVPATWWASLRPASPATEPRQRSAPRRRGLRPLLRVFLEVLAAG
jgi:LCP family protein required for cell wall assembly